MTRTIYTKICSCFFSPVDQIRISTQCWQHAAGANLSLRRSTLSRRRREIVAAARSANGTTACVFVCVCRDRGGGGSRPLPEDTPWKETVMTDNKRCVISLCELPRACRRSLDYLKLLHLLLCKFGLENTTQRKTEEWLKKCNRLYSTPRYQQTSFPTFDFSLATTMLTTTTEYRGYIPAAQLS